MRRAAAALATGALTAAGSPGGHAASTAPSFRHGHSSLRGDCSFAGRVVFTPALRTSPQPGRGTAHARGTCTGSLATGRHTRSVTGAAARYWATDASPQMDCEGGRAAGHGRIVVDGIVVAFRLVETRAAATSLLQLRGQGGSGTGQAHASPSADPVAQASACHDGDLHSSPVDITVHLGPAGSPVLTDPSQPAAGTR